MNKIIFHAGEYWQMNVAGEITRPGLVKPSQSWRVVGAVERNNFGQVVKRYTLSDILAGNVPDWQFKNGKQKVFVRDYDHGSIREWTCKHSIF